MGKVLLLNSEGCGYGDTDLAFEILVTLLDTLPKRVDGIPVAIVCWNNAVKLLAEGSPLLPRLRLIAEKGTDILAGKLCVNQLGLNGKLAVGRSATMDEILDLLLHHEVVSL